MTSLKYEARVPWLKGRGVNVYSQFGEDGLIEAIFEKIGTTNKQCFEVGASDGVFCSNTRKLVEAGWQALWIEGSAKWFVILLSQLAGLDGVAAVPDYITPENVNDLLGSLPDDLDLGVIDIDGDDYWVWEAMELQPRVMLVEYKPDVYGGELEAVPERGNGQAALPPIVELGTAKGYQLLATTFCNALFARSDVL